jgi:TRAP transporter 4TM/12TM fusion protein
MNPGIKSALDPRLWVGGGLIAFQYWILANPQTPLFERPVHLIVALFLVYLWSPLTVPWLPRLLRRGLDLLFLIGVAAVGWYYWSETPRLSTRIDNVSPVFDMDVAFGLLFVILLLEGVRRCVGWILLGVLLAFLAYGAFAHVLPGVLGFRGFGVREYIEILTMTTSGILGVTTETSVNFVFYFIAFGVVYAAVGGGQLFIDLAMRLVGTARGGGAKVAIVGSSLMGTISGSAVANVTSTGVFTIPLMRRSGVSGERAAATEAIASTGGQLMPPIMGVAAFVMAELLVVPYAQIALAGLIPAVAFYVALFISADLHARRSQTGTLTRAELGALAAILPRIHLLAPPLVLIACLVMGYSAQRAAMYATVSCLIVAFFKREHWLKPMDLIDMVRNVGRQVAEIAVPIGAIGIVIAVAIQSNMALKFSSGLIAAGGGTMAGSLILVIFGCIIMGMGLPTVAAYIIGAILYAPALQKLGLPTLAAHFFVFYYCVLSMVTPPVALASYAAAGLARTGAMKTSLIAFQMSFVAFLIPFAFIVDDALLFQDGLAQVVVACIGLFVSTAVWAVGLVGYFVRPLGGGDRILLLLCGLVAIVSPTGALLWWLGNGIAALFLVLNWKFPAVSLALPAGLLAGRGPRDAESAQ